MAFRWIGDRHQRVSKRYTTSSSAIAKIVALMVNSIPPAGASYVVVVLAAVPCEGIRCLDSRSRCQHSLGSDESIEIGIFGILYLTVTESSQSSCSFAALCELKFVKA